MLLLGILLGGGRCLMLILVFVFRDERRFVHDRGCDIDLDAVAHRQGDGIAGAGIDHLAINVQLCVKRPVPQVVNDDI